MKIVVTIPAYNEEKTIGKVIKEVKDVLKTKKYDAKILVLNDGSTDKTIEVSRKAGALVVSNKRNIGLAETFKKEMQECLKLKADIIVHTDADGQYPARYIPKLIEKIKEGNDLALGSRFGKKGEYSGSIMKRMGNRAFAHVFRNLLGIKISDTTTGFRAFTPEVANLPLTNNFTYTHEQLIRAGRAGLRIAEVPITTNKTRKSRLFSNSFDYALKAWINIIRIHRDFDPLKFFGKIGAAIFSIGFIIGLYLVYIQFFGGGINRHLALTVLDILILSIGVQVILFGLLADMQRK